MTTALTMQVPGKLLALDSHMYNWACAKFHHLEGHACKACKTTQLHGTFTILNFILHQLENSKIAALSECLQRLLLLTELQPRDSNQYASFNNSPEL